MKRPPQPTTLSPELLDVLAHMQVANNVAIMTLVKALEKSGAVRAEDYEALLRGMAAQMYGKGNTGPASLLDDLADLMKRDEVKKQ